MVGGGASASVRAGAGLTTGMTGYGSVTK
jgi:hypothetical protein